MDEVKTFQVKEICDICKVTRKALLIYEQKGLLTPYYVNRDSGYRYYNAENISKIMLIRKYQSFGFSLDEIYLYLHDTKALSLVFDRLSALKADLDATIEQLRLRMMTEEYAHQEIVRTHFDRRTYYARRKVTHGYDEAVDYLRETHLAAIATGKADKVARMHNAVLSYQGDMPDVYGTCEMIYCIPMADDYDGANAMVSPDTDAVAIFHRGAYATLHESIEILLAHCSREGIRQACPLRLIWLEGPPIHGKHEERYLTQIAIPIVN